MLVRLLIGLLLCCSVVKLSAQSAFKQSYDIVGDAFTKAYHTNTFDGGMVILGRSSNAMGGQYFTIFKTDANGDLQWSQRFLQPGNCNISNLVQLSDSSYFFCFVELNYPEKYYITKLDVAGNLVYCKSLSPPPNYIIAFDPTCIADNNGNVYVYSDLHNMSNSMFSWHLFKVDPLGSIVFSQCYNGGSIKCLGRGFTQCTNGDLLLTGYQRDSVVMHYGPVITRVDSNGNLLWSNLYLDSTSSIAGLRVLEMNSGNIVVTATHVTPGNEVVRIETDSAGYLLRSGEYGSPTHGLSPFTSSKVENDNQLIFGTTDSGSFCMKLDSVGNLLAAQRYYWIVPNSITVHSATGYCFGGVDTQTNHAVLFTSDTLLNSCFGDTITMLPSGNVFNTIPIPSSFSIALQDTLFPLQDTVWLATNFKECGPIGIPESTLSADVTIFPVPAVDVLHIETRFVPARIAVTDLTGNSVLITTPTATHTDVDVSSLSPGVYFLHISDAEQHLVRAFIVN